VGLGPDIVGRAAINAPAISAASHSGARLPGGCESRRRRLGRGGSAVVTAASSVAPRGEGSGGHGLSGSEGCSPFGRPVAAPEGTAGAEDRGTGHLPEGRPPPEGPGAVIGP
jgi:hypothetical protein